MKATEYLIQEHKLILRALDLLDAMSATIEKGQAVDLQDGATVLDFLRWFGDAHHQAKEETILFPALKSGPGFGKRSIRRRHAVAGRSHDDGSRRTEIRAPGTVGSGVSTVNGFDKLA